MDHGRHTHAELAGRSPGLRRHCVNLIERARFKELGFDGFSDTAGGVD